MAEISKKVIKDGFKLISVQDFREQYAGGVSPQAISYAIKQDQIDYVQISPTVRIIVLTAKTLQYNPNASPKRGNKSRLSL